MRISSSKKIDLSTMYINSSLNIKNGVNYQVTKHYPTLF